MDQPVHETLPTESDEFSDTYTWEEYQALSLEEQDAFFQSFESVEAFEAWMKTVKPAEGTVPALNWDASGKQPDAYTWEEYEALSAEEKDAFYLWFGSAAGFEAWMDAVKPVETVETVAKWDKPGKQPDTYTWEEYQALNAKEQDAFYQWFASKAEFEAWMDAAKPGETTEPAAKWNKPGKQPDAYTWEEYQALSSQAQEAFYQWFDSVDAFEAWMEAVKPGETTEPAAKWDKPGKQPNAYTWEEYQALSPKEQDAFYLWFGSVKAFEAWMEAVKPAETTETVEKWDKPGKQPDAYTWEEYQALSPQEQDAFFLWFDSVEAFEAWMDVATGEP